MDEVIFPHFEMKQILYITAFILCLSGGFIKAFSQEIGNRLPATETKNPIDSNAIKAWQILESTVSITDDGNYFLYIIKNKPVGNFSLNIVSTDKRWKKEIVFKEYPVAFFSDDGKQAIIQQTDTLYFVFLGTDSCYHVSNVTTTKTPSKTKDWLAYKVNGCDKLFLRNLFTGKEIFYDSVAEYSFSENGNILLFITKSSSDSLSNESVNWISLRDMAQHTIWTTKDSALSRGKWRVANYTVDERRCQLAFMVKDEIMQDSCSIWYYKLGMTKAVLKVNLLPEEIGHHYSISKSLVRFSLDGNYIFFRIKKCQNTTTLARVANKVEVWSYRDHVLQSAKPSNELQQEYLTSLNLDGHRVVRVECEDEFASMSDARGQYILVANKKSAWDYEPWAHDHTQRQYFLVSLKDGSRKMLVKRGRGLANYYFSFSPSGKYLVYFDSRMRNYFCYDVSLGLTRNISRDISVPLTQENKFLKGSLPFRSKGPVGIGGWLKGDSSILVYDNYDIWLLDARGKNASKNVTNGYGFRKGIKFRLINEDEFFSEREPLLLSAFNTKNKHNGFALKTLTATANPELLSMGPHAFYITGSQVPSMHYGMTRPLKAGSIDRWVVQRQAANEAPNFFLTNDFKRFQKLTDCNPQRSYNWLTSELVSWTQPDGTKSQGVLYKPENFDVRRKYPVIFYYYEQFSSDLFMFPDVAYSDGPINIPWFVSNGYLVFTPDICFKVGYVGKSALNTVMSASKYLIKKPWVDGKSLGLQGHSFGGYLTNYIVTHSNLFAAASSGAGVSDLVSNYSELRGGSFGIGVNNQFYYESYQGRMGATLWQRPKEYIENSPVFALDRVTTPLLVLHNKKDEIVSWSQGIELYSGLRRLGKRIWMLQYDNSDHSVSEDAVSDYTIRLTQFFDHYLKKAPCPIWMTQGNAGPVHGVTGCDIDPAGDCGSQCSVCKKWKKKSSKTGI